MSIFLDRSAILEAGTAAIGHPPEVVDWGLLDSAVARPQASAFGDDAYPTLHAKAAALLQSLARNHVLVDGNKRTAWGAAWTFLILNGVYPAPYDVDAAEAFVNDVATGKLVDISEIADLLKTYAL